MMEMMFDKEREEERERERESWSCSDDGVRDD